MSAETSPSNTVPAVKGTNTASPVAGVEGPCVGVEGESAAGWGVYGHSKTGRGVVAISENDYGLRAASTKSAGIRGSSVEGRGVEGWATKSEGVVGISTTGNGVWGQTEGAGTGVLGTSGSGTGVFGQSNSGVGVIGKGIKDAGVNGFHGDPHLQETTVGSQSTHAGVFGASEEGAGVMGYSRNTGSFGVIAFGGILASAINHPLAGEFNGKVQVNGDVQVSGDIFLTGADCAEHFDIGGSEQIEPGSVVVIDAEGALRQSRHPYDKKVAGVVSGGGSYKPAIVLDNQQSKANRLPVALVGKVFCNADAGYGPIEVGDLLTSSPTPGCAMKADDPARAFGSVIGKALRPLATGRGCIPILVALQ